jgi:hypothetical protein
MGFGLVLANSGWNSGGASISFYDPEGNSIDFDFADSVRFPQRTEHLLYRDLS